MKRILPALLALALASTLQAEEYKDGVIYCKASVVDTGDKVLSVCLPPTAGYVDYQGNPATVWNIGEVPPGGAADTFFSDKGPGAFQVKNDGTCAAFIYVSTGTPSDYHPSPMSVYPGPSDESLQFIFGDIDIQHPQPSDTFNNGLPYREYYRLAVSTDVTGKIPVWRPLNWMYGYDNNSGCERFREFSTGESPWNIDNWDFDDYCYQYLTYLAPGETQLFDLKFFAPNTHQGNWNLGFVIVLQASEFRAWAHDM